MWICNYWSLFCSSGKDVSRWVTESSFPFDAHSGAVQYKLVGMLAILWLMTPTPTSLPDTLHFLHMHTLLNNI